MCAAQKKILPFVQISTDENVQYANCFTVLALECYMYRFSAPEIRVRFDIVREPDTCFKAFQHTKRLGRLIKHLTILDAVNPEMRQIIIRRKIAYQIRMTVLRDHLIGIDVILLFVSVAVKPVFQLSVKSAVTVMEG